MEAQILKWYQQNIEKGASFPTYHQEGYDIICPAVKNVEVKEDCYACNTGNYAIEFEDASGKPSGINSTTAGQFVLVDKEAVVIFETEAFKYFLRELNYKPILPMGYKTLNGKQARGWLIPREKVLASPYAKILERWFP